MEFGGSNGTADITKAVLAALYNLTRRHCEERSDEAIHFYFARRHRLLQLARMTHSDVVVAGCYFP